MEYKTENGEFLIKTVEKESNELQAVFYIGPIKFTAYRKIPSCPDFKVPRESYPPSKKMIKAAIEYSKNYFSSKPQARLL